MLGNMREFEVHRRPRRSNRMLTDLAQAIRNYLHDVFVIQFSWWVVLGFLAQAMFFMRFAVQWVASERAGRSVIPTAFCIFSVIGSLLLLIYALQRKDTQGPSIHHRPWLESLYLLAQPAVHPARP
jgi:lipid-A-disaccharide synthase-like uncharacterized protein